YLSRILTPHQQIANEERPSSAVVFQQAVRALAAPGIARARKVLAQLIFGAARTAGKAALLVFSGRDAYHHAARLFSRH
ncbi:MAG: hypothetical protein RI601_11820, partial [Desulfurivibrionaceae bacterium]|nr:hypothetical protein [Desulfurivibrionaceae bacterium]